MSDTYESTRIIWPGDIGPGLEFKSRRVLWEKTSHGESVYLFIPRGPVDILWSNDRGKNVHLRTNKAYYQSLRGSAHGVGMKGQIRFGRVSDRWVRARRAWSSEGYQPRQYKPGNAAWHGIGSAA